MHKPSPCVKLLQQAQPILSIENTAATALISLFGGQILSYVPVRDGRERLWLSDKTIWDGSQPLRGGVPVCWPWFGDHPDKQYPIHGYVQRRLWQCVASTEYDDSTCITLEPEDCQGEGFNGQASLSLELNIGTELSIKLTTGNIGSKTFSYTAALHSYFKVQDIGATVLTGLSGQYADKPRGFKIFTTPRPYRFSEETDRIHLTTAGKVSIVEKNNNIDVFSRGHDSIVVWNPWRENSSQLADMQSGAYQHMLCVETALTKGKILKPDEQHIIAQKIR